MAVGLVGAIQRRRRPRRRRRRLRFDESAVGSRASAATATSTAGDVASLHPAAAMVAVTAFLLLGGVSQVPSSVAAAALAPQLQEARRRGSSPLPPPSRWAPWPFLLDVAPAPAARRVGSSGSGSGSSKRWTSQLFAIEKHVEEGGDDGDDLFSLTPEDLLKLPPGLTNGFYVTWQHALDGGSSRNMDDELRNLLDPDQLRRMEITSSANLTLPVALMLADPLTYPTLSRARKACRKGSILVHRRRLRTSNGGDITSGESATTGAEKGRRDGRMTTTTPQAAALSFDDPATTFKGRVGDRVYPDWGDVIARQVRIGSGYFPILSHRKPPFGLPVVYEDDHFALVDKPAGVVVYKQNKGGHGIMTVRAALPFALRPPKSGTYSVLRRPSAVHRLDKPTSGILVIAKTKPARMNLSRQFHDRVIRKTYTAIVNGIPEEGSHEYDGAAASAVMRRISSREAHELGVDVDPVAHEEGDDSSSSSFWQCVDSPLDGKHAVTVWRAVRYVKSMHANDGYLTVVELKPKTGRFHQLRRHLAWVCGRPIVGDDEYDGGTPGALKFRTRGLFLCSNGIALEHPYYNTPHGRAVWEEMCLDDSQSNEGSSSRGLGNDSSSAASLWYCAEKDKVMVTASVSLPDKFRSLLSHEEERYDKFAASSLPPSSSFRDETTAG